MPEETMVRPATRLNAGVVVCRMLMDALATVVSSSGVSCHCWPMTG